MSRTLDFTQPHLLRDEEEYRAAVAEIDRLLDLDPPATNADHERLEFLSLLVEEYERDDFPIDPEVTPQEAVEFMLDQKGWTRADLGPLMGGRSRVSEFFSNKRELSKGQIEALFRELGVPPDLLLRRGAA